jgi:beta-lactamase regulating signal transducer with metallopeptidase domain
MAGGRCARVLVSGRVRVPFSCGLLRPAVVLPRPLAETAPVPVLRWVLAHELTHLERRDAWAGCLLGLGQAVYFYLPWFWWVGRQVRLCQEYVADASAAGSRAEDYAQFRGRGNWHGAQPSSPPAACV